MQSNKNEQSNCNGIAILLIMIINFKETNFVHDSENSLEIQHFLCQNLDIFKF